MICLLVFGNSIWATYFHLYQSQSCWLSKLSTSWVLINSLTRSLVLSARPSTFLVVRLHWFFTNK
jgi:hypothetical protein